MYPTLFPGDLLTIHASDRGYQRGDLILAELLSGLLVVHRVVANHPQLIIKGDANASVDTEVKAVLGRVTAVQRSVRSRLRRCYWPLLMAARRLQKSD